MRRSEIFTRPLSDVLLEADHDDLEFEPDPYGRANLDRWVRKKYPMFDPTVADPAIDRMREAWKRNALLDEGGDALFETRAGVGDDGANGRVDVAKIETLLAALGAFDLDSLDGPTGFFAANKGDAIRAFQRANGLTENGAVHPRDDTMRALKAAVQPKIRQALAARQAAHAKRDGPAATTTSRGKPEGTAQADRMPSPQLAQSAVQSSPPPPKVPDRTSNAPPSPTPIIPVPGYKKDYFKNQPKSWPTWTQLIGSLPNLHSSEKRAYMEIFAAEGGDRLDTESGAMSGITKTTIDRAIDKVHVKGIKSGTEPKTLSLEARSRLYRAYFDHAFDRIGGSRAFGLISDAEAASAVADTLFRHGRNGGGALIRKAINAVVPGSLAERVSSKLGLPFNETALSEFQRTIADPANRRKFLEALADERIKVAPNEADRFNHFRFQNVP